MTNDRKDAPVRALATLIPPYLDYAYFANGGQHPFQHATKQFAMVNAWWLIEAATLVYADHSFVQAQLQKAGLTLANFFDHKGTQCLVASSDDFAIVAFRGTEVGPRRSEHDAPGSRPDFRNIFIDLLTDARFKLTDFASGAQVHGGFREALDDVWEAHDGNAGLKSYLLHLNDDGRARTVWFTGHSLGGALATLAVARCGDMQGLDVHGLYTFGSPLVGDSGFGKFFGDVLANKFQIEHYRFVNNQDIVTTVPPETFHYQHTGALKFIRRNGEISDRVGMFDGITNFASGVLRRAFDSTGTVNSKVISLVPEQLLDHVPTLYATHIWNAHVKEIK
jgi:triacylglycerol lipase